MIEWSEGQLRLSSLVKALYANLLERESDEAVDICNEIVAEARMIRAKIVSDKEKGSPHAVDNN